LNNIKSLNAFSFVINIFYFKPKSNKKIKFNKKSAITTDIKHKEFLNEFSKDENNIYNYKVEIAELNKKLLENEEELNIEEKLEINDRIIELKENIKERNNKKKKEKEKKQKNQTNEMNQSKTFGLYGFTLNFQLPLYFFPFHSFQ